MRNYLRVRGEYRSRSSGVRSRPELPPRARRILLVFVTVTFYRGTTSACAENTPATGGSCTQNWNYLRVRGEYIAPWRHRAMAVELPPRARRILLVFVTVTFYRGTTSACAENTPATGGSCTQNWNYLRVRGEYIAPWRHRAMAVELPPRARRIPLAFCETRTDSRTTSACAENTPAACWRI